MKKKIVSGILIAATVLALTGCGSSDEKQISGNVNNNEQAKTQQQKGAGSSKDNSKNENTGKDYVFKINNTEWTIEEADEATINNEMKSDGILGVTIYRTQTIMLLKDQANIIKTLKHELTHVWLYEYGHNQNDDKTFTYEDVCEVVASINDFINEIINKYFH